MKKARYLRGNSLRTRCDGYSCEDSKGYVRTLDSRSDGGKRIKRATNSPQSLADKKRSDVCAAEALRQDLDSAWQDYVEKEFYHQQDHVNKPIFIVTLNDSCLIKDAHVMRS
jgi:hypothetical protein